MSDRPKTPSLRTARTAWPVLALALAGATGLAAQETHRLSGQSVAIYNLAGEARIVAGSGSDVVVRVERGGADGGRLEVRTDEGRGRQVLGIVYPADEIVYSRMDARSSNTTTIRSDGTFGGGRGGRRVRVRGSGRGLEAWADLVVEVPRGREVAVHVATGRVEAENVDGEITIDTGSGSVRAARMAGRLFIDTGSGGVDVRGMRGDLGVDTGSGSITVEDVDADDIVLDTGSGRVRGEGLRSSGLRVDTGSGSIELSGVTATDVVLDTGSGSVDITLTRDIDRLDVDTGSGSVTVRAPSDLGADVEIETGSGGIDVDFPVQVRTIRRDELRGTIGDGRGRIRIDTGSGGVRLVATGFERR